MTKIQAIQILGDIEGLLTRASRLTSTSQAEVTRMQNDARRNAREIQDIIRLIKKLDQEANG